VGLLIVALALIGLSYADGKSSLLHGIKAASASVFGGAEHAGSSVAGVFSSSNSSSSQVTKLQQEVVRLRAELSGANLSKTEYAQLHQLLLVAGAGGYRIVASRVIALGQGFQQTVTLDVGSADGVKVGQTVLNGQGLVGSVTAVAGSTCTVLLADDSSSVIGVAVAPGGQLGYVSGPGKTSGGGLMKLQMLNSTSVLKVGEQLVTWAAVHNKPYVPGVPVGTITKLLNRNGSLTAIAQVRPFVNYGALGIVGVVVSPPNHNPRFAVLPPLPHPGPTVTVTVPARKPGASASPSPSAGG
jgi:rod shape-determining protein MreC